jgi:hypothetical protein
MKNTILCLAALFLGPGIMSAASYRVGVSRVDITPQGPIWMSGYASRTHPSEGVFQNLYAKALAFEDSKGGQVVIVTTDLIGLPRVISDAVAASVQKQHGLDRSRLLFNSSHTHTGPVVRGNLVTMYGLDGENGRAVQEYSRKLTENLVQLVGAALADLKPADVSYGTGEAAFAVNRRQFTPTGVKIGVNPQGAIDHTVPVLKISNPDGSLRAVLFAYACHNTTLTGEFYKLSGDYAGFAQSEIEKAHPGVTALFMMLCGADQNPNPRSTLELAETHGKELAKTVNGLLDTKLEKVDGPIRTAFLLTELPLSPHTRETFEAMKTDKNQSKARLAETMLKAYDERHPVRSVQYPVQAIRFGKDHTILALGGEVVVGYDLRAKKEFPNQKLIVAGYSNDVMCYIPTAKILEEGGYEAVDSMIYYGQPAPFTPDVEESIFTAIHKTMKRVGIQ